VIQIFCALLHFLVISVSKPTSPLLCIYAAHTTRCLTLLLYSLQVNPNAANHSSANKLRCQSGNQTLNAVCITPHLGNFLILKVTVCSVNKIMLSSLMNLQKKKHFLCSNIKISGRKRNYRIYSRISRSAYKSNWQFRVKI